MEVTGDELAGVVDLFGGLTREELGNGLAELAFKDGEEFEPDTFADDIDRAVESYHLIELEPGDLGAEIGSLVLVAGPAAFPELPENAGDLLYILDIDQREIDRETAGRRATERFRAEAARAVDADADTQADSLIDVSYELEAWADVDLSDVRDRLDAARRH